MRSAVWLRAASVVAFAQFVAHTAMFLSAKASHGPAEVAVVEAMKSQKFLFDGSLRSYWDLYFGYGLFAAFNCLVEAVLFWQLARLAKAGAAHGRPIVALYCIANLGYALLVLRYFFIVPLVPDLVIAVCLALAWRREIKAD
jgi:hypothetical protein